jgi:aspartyl-tRNA synthetase
MFQSRTHTCGQLRAADAGQTVTLCGWMENVREVGSSFAFLVLRDFYGTTQVVIETPEMMAVVKPLNKESTISVTGTVRIRESKNPKQATGEIEVVPTEIKVLGRCRYNELPFEINRSREADETQRLKYRYLDLRNPAVKNNIILRCNVVSALRQAMTEHGFLEITTPILTASSPEGARDYLVPSRKHPGKFYALPQAPQQFKQLLMTSGFDRYFQIAPCFRDEDARGDRSPGEFFSWIWRWPLPPKTTSLRCWRTCCPLSLPSTAPTMWPPPPPSAASATGTPWRPTALTSPTCALT